MNREHRAVLKGVVEKLKNSTKTVDQLTSGVLHDHATGQYCAIGYLAREIGIDSDDLVGRQALSDKHASYLTFRTGLESAQLTRIMEVNDSAEDSDRNIKVAGVLNRMLKPRKRR